MEPAGPEADVLLSGYQFCKGTAPYDKREVWHEGGGVGGFLLTCPSLNTVTCSCLVSK